MIENLNDATIEELLTLAFPEGLPKVDPRMLPTGSRDTPERQQVAVLVGMFERGQVGGDLRKKIFENRERFKAPGDRIKADACTRLLAIAEERQPTPVGWPRYV